MVWLKAQNKPINKGHYLSMKDGMSQPANTL